MKWRELLETFDSTRRAGHTWAAAQGARATGGVVICLTMAEAHRVTEQTNAEAISVNLVESLRGRPRPMVVDNHVVAMMAAEIMRLEARSERDAAAYFELTQERRRLKSELFFHQAALEAMAILRQDARLRGAFHCLAMVGLAIELVTLKSKTPRS